MIDYDREYQKCNSACGEPFPEFADFFRSMPPARFVLDLGCGQGRDTLLAARLGHSVYGVDIAASGVAQLMKRAEAEGLDVNCEVLDIESFRADRFYDVVVLDRVLHMLPTEERRKTMLRRAQEWVAPAGHLLVADTQKNQALIRGCFTDEGWEPVLKRKGCFFGRKVLANS